MYKIILKSFNFLEDFAKTEIENITQKKVIAHDNESYEIQAEDKKELIQLTYNLVYYSRCFDGIYLQTDETFNTLEKVEIDIKDKPIEVYDLVGDILMERNYKINEDDNYLSHFLVNYCLFKLNLNQEEKLFSVIDPMAELGDVLIETALFHPRKPLYVRQKNSLPIYTEFKIMPPMPKIVKDKNKYVGLVLEDDQFKKFRENINEAGLKIRVSKFEMDWMDVKFHKNDFDYAITFLPDFEDKEESDEFLKEFIYQTEFVCKKKICLISFEEIDLKYATKYKLELTEQTKVEVDEEEFFCYFFKSNQ